MCQGVCYKDPKDLNPNCNDYWYGDISKFNQCSFSVYLFLSLKWIVLLKMWCHLTFFEWRVTLVVFCCLPINNYKLCIKNSLKPGWTKSRKTLGEIFFSCNLVTSLGFMSLLIPTTTFPNFHNDTNMSLLDCLLSHTWVKSEIHHHDTRFFRHFRMPSNDLIPRTNNRLP